MANYSIVLTKDKRYDAIIYANSYISPIQDINEISLELSRLHIEGVVLFDMLLANGDNFNRFAEVYYDGTQIHLEKMEIIEVYDKCFLNEVNCFYKQNIDLLDNSVLSLSQRFSYSNK